MTKHVHDLCFVCFYMVLLHAVLVSNVTLKKFSIHQAYIISGMVNMFLTQTISNIPPLIGHFCNKLRFSFQQLVQLLRLRC
jgi:hypothetical protein